MDEQKSKFNSQGIDDDEEGQKAKSKLEQWVDSRQRRWRFQGLVYLPSDFARHFKALKVKSSFSPELSFS